MNAKITIEDDTHCIVLSLDEAKELYEDLKTFFGPQIIRPGPPWGDSSKLFPGNPGDDWKSGITECGTGELK